MAYSNPWGKYSPLEYKKILLELGFINEQDHIEKHTNKEFLINRFKMSEIQHNRVKPFTLGYNTLSRDAEHLSPGQDVKLTPENIVDINTLSKSIGKVLVGKVFLGRVLINASQRKAIAFVAEDPSGDRGINAYVYNSPYHYTSFNVGTFFVTLNPYFKETLDGGLGLRSDLAGEVIILTENQLKDRFPLIEWKSLTKEEDMRRKLAAFKRSGNEHFVVDNYASAIASYTAGISLCAYDRDLLSNRAVCYLKMEDYHNAVNDASLCVTKYPSHVKAIYRLARGYIGLKQYDKAKNILEDKLKTDVPRVDLMALLKTTNDYIAQRDFGQFEMAKLFMSTGKAVKHDVADYYGPVKVVDVGLKGRGLIATEDVQPGQLLLSAKAFAIHFSEDNEKRLNDSTNAIGIKSELSLLDIIQQKIYKHPELGKDLYALTAGKELGNLNADRDDCTKVEKIRIESIIKINGVRVISDKNHCEGLWIQQSYINNDCVNCNARVTIFGDVSQVRCIKALKAGDEILIPYREHACPFWERVMFFQEKDFVCQCDLCLYESREPNDLSLRRDALLRNYHEDMYTDPKKLKQLVMKIRSLSKDSPYVKYYVALPLLSLANVYEEQNEVYEAIVNYEEFLRDSERYGGDITFHLYQACTKLFYLYFRKRDMVNAKIWRGRLREYVNLNYGSCDNRLLEVMHPGIITCFVEVDA